MAKIDYVDYTDYSDATDDADDSRIDSMPKKEKSAGYSHQARAFSFSSKMTVTLCC